MFDKLKKSILGTLCILLLSPTIAYADVLKLDIDGVVQQKTNWCWAASAKSVSDYLGGNGLSQTKIVTNVKGSAINEGASPSEQKKALTTDGISTTYTNGTISYSKIKTMIEGWYSPILAHIAWTDGGAHAVVIYGYDDDDDDCVTYMDPWGSNSRWNYTSIDDFKDNDDFSWVRTYYNNTEE